MIRLLFIRIHLSYDIRIRGILFERNIKVMILGTEAKVFVNRRTFGFVRIAKDDLFCRCQTDIYPE